MDDNAFNKYLQEIQKMEGMAELDQNDIITIRKWFEMTITITEWHNIRKYDIDKVLSYLSKQLGPDFQHNLFFQIRQHKRNIYRQELHDICSILFIYHFSTNDSVFDKIEKAQLIIDTYNEGISENPNNDTRKKFCELFKIDDFKDIVKDLKSFNVNDCDLKKEDAGKIYIYCERLKKTLKEINDYILPYKERNMQYASLLTIKSYIEDWFPGFVIIKDFHNALLDECLRFEKEIIANIGWMDNSTINSYLNGLILEFSNYKNVIPNQSNSVVKYLKAHDINPEEIHTSESIPNEFVLSMCTPVVWRTIETVDEKIYDPERVYSFFYHNSLKKIISILKNYLPSNGKVVFAKKLEVKLSVPDLALLFRLLDDEKLLVYKTKKELYNFITESFITIGQDKISQQSIANFMNSPEGKSSKYWSLTLVRMKQNAEKLNFKY